MSFKIFFCNLNFLILTPASEITLQIFSGTPFRSWTFWTKIVTIKYELYQNLGPHRSILKVLESKNWGGGGIRPPPCNVGLSQSGSMCLTIKNICFFLIFLFYSNIVLIGNKVVLPLLWVLSMFSAILTFQEWALKLGECNVIVSRSHCAIVPLK